MVNISYETPYSENNFETKLQSEFDKYDQSFEQQKEEETDFKETNVKNSKNW